VGICGACEALGVNLGGCEVLGASLGGCENLEGDLGVCEGLGERVVCWSPGRLRLSASGGGFS